MTPKAFLIVEPASFVGLCVLFYPVPHDIAERIDNLWSSRLPVLRKWVVAAIGLNRDSQCLIARLTWLQNNVLIHVSKRSAAFGVKLTESVGAFDSSSAYPGPIAISPDPFSVGQAVEH